MPQNRIIDNAKWSQLIVVNDKIIIYLNICQ